MTVVYADEADILGECDQEEDTIHRVYHPLFLSADTTTADDYYRL